MKYTVTAYTRHSERDDAIAKTKSGLTARAAAKLAVQYARQRGIDAGVAIRLDEDATYQRVGSTGSSVYGSNVIMRCHNESPHYRAKDKPVRRSVVKCEIKKPDFKAALKIKRRR